MKLQINLTGILFLALVSCGDKNEVENTSVEETNPSVEQNISSQAIERLDYTEYVLSPEAETAINRWEKYQEFAIQINFLKKADLSFFVSEGKLLEDFFTQLKTSIPPNLKTNPIESRLLILETKSLKLRDNITLENIKIPLQLSSIKEVLVAFSNLNLQINKKLEFDEYNKIQPE